MSDYDRPASPMDYDSKSNKYEDQPANDRSRSRSRSPRRSRSRSPRRRSPRRLSNERRRRSPSRSRSKERKRRSVSPRRRSRSPRRYRASPRNRDQHGTRENPEASCILGIFGLSSRTREGDLEDVCREYGAIEKVILVYDRKTGTSRGFGFVYFKEQEDATRAREALNGIDIDGRQIRVDYSVTHRAHSPTPGEYMGERRSGGYDRDRYRYRRYRSRSPPPRRRYYRSRSRSRSWSR